MIVKEIDLTGKTLSNYKIIGRLGKGGMATVYKAHELSLNRVVALKVLSPQLSEDKDYIKRFQREAQAAAQLNHANIVQVYAIGEDQGVHYFAMEYIKGDSLADLKQDAGIVAPDKAVPIMIQVADALGEAHRIGLVHRDIKPSNIMLDAAGKAKVTDFGIAYVSSAKTKLTREGSIIGTPEYLSPEQCEGKTVDQRSDIYSLGVTLYELLSGKTPYEADTPVSMLMKIVKGEFPPLKDVNPNVPEALRNIVDKMMETDVNKRYGSMEELISAFQHFQEETGAKPAAAGAAAGAAGAAGAEAAEKPPKSGPSTMTYEQMEIQENVKSGSGSSLATFWVALLIVLIVGGAFAAKVFYFDKQAEKKQTVATDQTTQDDKTGPPIASEPPTDSKPDVDTRQASMTGTEGEGTEDKQEIQTSDEAGDETGTEPDQQESTDVTTVEAHAGAVPLPSTSTGEAASAETGSAPITTTGQQPKTPQTGTAQTGTAGTAAPKPKKQKVQRPQPPPKSCLIAIEGDEEKSDLLTPYIQEILTRKNFNVVDAPATSDREISEVARNLVVVKVRNIGSTTLEYYGRSTEQYSIQLVIKVVAPKTGTLIAGPITRTVKYTSLNAEENLRQAVKAAINRLLPKLRAHN